MRTRTLPTAVLTILALAVGASSAHAGPDSGDLYLQEATSGKLSGSKLVLRGVSPRTTTFTDRPQRRASSLTTRSFTSGFGRTFRGDPPNAALQIAGAPSRRDVAILELRRPRFNAKKKTLTYTVRRLKTTTGGLSRLGRKADRGVSGSFRRATLFIDDGGSGDQFGIVMSAPAGQTISMTLGGGSSFDLEFNSTIIPLNPGTTPNLAIQGQTMTVAPNNSSAPGSVAVLVETWIDAASSPLTGTAVVPPGGIITVVPVGDSSVEVDNGPFSVPFD